MHPASLPEPRSRSDATAAPDRPEAAFTPAQPSTPPPWFGTALRFVAAAIAVAVLVRMTGAFAPALRAAAVAAIALAALDRLVRAPRERASAYGALAACAALPARWLAAVFAGNWSDPHTWDFLAFYVDGSVAARGLDFYDPRAYQRTFTDLRIPFVPEIGFIEEIVDAGFKYPPVTMFLFAPLGAYAFAPAHAGWLAFVAATTLAAALLVAGRLDGRAPRGARVLCAVAVVAAMPAIARNAFHEQTSALLLALALAALAAGGSRWAGVWAGLALCVKPLMAVAVLHLAVRRHAGATGIAIASVAAGCLAALVVFGPRTTLHYLEGRWMARVPEWQYTGWTNQSLLGTLLRLDPALPAAALSYPPFLVAAGWVAVLSVVLAARLDESRADLAFGLLLCAALLLYPGTLESYSALLLVPLVALHARRDALPRGRWLAPLGIAAIYAIAARVAFVANALVWLALVAVAFVVTRRARAAARTPAPRRA